MAINLTGRQMPVHQHHSHLLRIQSLLPCVTQGYFRDTSLSAKKEQRQIYKLTKHKVAERETKKWAYSVCIAHSWPRFYPQYHVPCAPLGCRARSQTLSIDKCNTTSPPLAKNTREPDLKIAQLTLSHNLWFQKVKHFVMMKSNRKSRGF